MSLRVIWQYMDRSVTKKILYEPQKLRSIYYSFGDGPVHILPYDPQCHELFAICLIIIKHSTQFDMHGFCDCPKPEIWISKVICFGL